MRFNAVSYLAEVWLNGERLGEHEGGYLPFVFDITDRVMDAGNDARRARGWSVRAGSRAAGKPGRAAGASFPTVNYPDTNFDFFPYCGIQRPVLIYTEPRRRDHRSDRDDRDRWDKRRGPRADRAYTRRNGLTRVSRSPGTGRVCQRNVAWTSASGSVQLTVPEAALWSPETPNLYDLRVELLRDGARCGLLHAGDRHPHDNR